MTTKEKTYIENVIDHFVEMYKLDLKPYNKAYRIWFEKELYGEIVLDFLLKTKIQTNIRLIRTPTRTKEEPNLTGYIRIDPKNAPFFASNDFKKRRFEICIDPSQYKRFEYFICTVIHELAHLVLYSTFNKYKDSEVATDLFVMAFGLYEESYYIKERMKGVSGYITPEQVEYAYKYIKKKYASTNAQSKNKRRGILKFIFGS